MFLVDLAIETSKNSNLSLNAQIEVSSQRIPRIRRKEQASAACRPSKVKLLLFWAIPRCTVHLADALGNASN